MSNRLSALPAVEIRRSLRRLPPNIRRCPKGDRLRAELGEAKASLKGTDPASKELIKTPGPLAGLVGTAGGSNYTGPKGVLGH